MKREEVVAGGLYRVKDDHSLFEINAEVVNCDQVEGTIYSNNEKSVRKIIEISELTPIETTNDILQLLSFTEIYGNLAGLPNEHYFELKIEGKTITVINEKGRYCYVQQDGKANYGCKFVGIPYLHQLQHLLAPIHKIDIQNVIKHVMNKV